MLSINCLIKNSGIQKSLKDIVESAGYDLAAQTGNAKLSSLFNVLRSAGIELDIQTLSHIYEDIFDTDDPAFSDDQEIEDARQYTMRKMSQKEVKVKLQEIGMDKPSVGAVVNLMNTLIKNIHIKSQQRIMQDRLTKAAKRILGIKGNASEIPLKELFEEVLSTERFNDFYGLGMMENAQTLFDELGKELEQEGMDYDNAEMQQMGEILQDSVLDFLASSGEIKRMVDETLKNEGYQKMINKNGVPHAVVDWDKVIAGNADFKAALKALFVKQGIDDRQSDNLVRSLAAHYHDILAKKVARRLDQKNKAAVDKTTVHHQKKNIDRLVTLYNLGIFQNANQAALTKMLGIGNLQRHQLMQVRQVMSAYQTIMHGTSMVKWSPTVIRTFQRQVEMLIASFENKEMAVRVMSKISVYMQFSNALILVNPQNVSENILSGAFEAHIVTPIINPEGFSKGFSDMVDKFLDFSKGGTRVGEEKSNAFNRGGNIEDIYNRETKGMKRADVVLAAIPRIALGAADNAFKHSIIQSLIAKALQQYLVRFGADKQEAKLILNETYYGNRKEIERLARAMSGSIVSAGVHTETSGQGAPLNEKERIMAAELSLANMMTEGEFFKETINGLIASGKLSAAFAGKFNLNEDVLKAIRGAVGSTAAKALGHEGDNEILKKLFDNQFDKLNEAIDKAKKARNWGAYIEQMFYKLALAGISKFRSGSFNWLFLGFQKATGISLLMTLIFDVALGKSRGIPQSFGQVDFVNQKNLEVQLSKYMALRQRLVRETVAPLISLALTGAYLLSVMGGGSDEEKKKRLKRAKENLDSHPAQKRWLNKLGPGMLYTYLANIHGMRIEDFPVITEEDAKKLRDNDIYDVSMDNLPRIKDVLALTDGEVAEVAARIDKVNGEELPSLVRAYMDPTYQWESQKFNIQPNPAVQWIVDMGDKTKPNKGAITGQAAGAILNFGGALQSYDIWKNAFTNPEKIPGEWKIIQPDDFGEGLMYKTLNKDLYKKLFVGESAYRQRPFDLPHIGSVKVAKLADAGITEVTEDNIYEVQSKLDLSDDDVQDIRESMKFHKEKMDKIRGK